jgi:leishmanolysin-like peptidase
MKFIFLLFIVVECFGVSLRIRRELNRTQRILGNIEIPDIPSYTNSYTCIHDYLYESTADAVHGIQEYASDASSLQLNSNRRLQTSTSSSTSWNSIRIVPIYVGFSSLSITVSQFITTKLIPSAISKWQSLLSVNRVIGPLFAHRECNSYWTNSNGAPYLCAEFSQETLCESGATGDTTISFTSTYRNYLGIDLLYSNVNGKLISSSVSGGNGLLNADLGLFITSVTSTECSSSSGVLAYASTCQRDQLDRPTFGRINFCPNNLDANNIDKLESQIAVAIHEIGHVLGFSSASFPLFRNIDDQSPLTPRNNNYPSVPSDEFWVSRTCNNIKVTSWISSQTTLGYSSTRGMTSANCGTAYKGAEECVL